MGPGGDNAMRERVAEMMYFIRESYSWENFTFLPMQNAGLLVTLNRPVQDQDEEGLLIHRGEAYRRRLMLIQLWGLIVHLDGSMQADPINATWRVLMDNASDDWFEQHLH